jgi:DNA-binding LacI/PurR family transcriptional regulator
LLLKRLRTQILKKEKVTLKFLAKDLGLDISTVSKALNNKPDISRSTCERVKKYAVEVGYRPNLLAKGLINKRTHMLGVIIPDLRLSFYSQVLEGIQQSAEEKGYMPILLLNDDNEHIERKNLEFFASLPVDGILIDTAPGKQNISLMNNITQQGIPLMFYDRYIAEVKASRITIDDIMASHDLTMSLIKSGKRKIAYMGPTEGMSVASDRFRGYVNALSQAGIVFDEQLVLRCKIDETDSKLHIRNLLKKGIVPDGVVCMGGLVALGAGETLLRAGYKIPGDFLLAEFGDNDIVAKLGVPYRSINQSPFEIGKSAVSLICEEIERNRDIEEFRHVIIPFTLIEH